MIYQKNNCMISVDDVVKVLDNGGVALLPTDTVPGLAVKPSIKKAVEKIYTLKKRPKELNLPIMVSKQTNLSDLGLDVNANVIKLLNSKYMPGALTIVLGFKGGLMRPEWLNGRDEVAIRIPDDEFLLNVLNNSGPLLVTSANIHGCKNTQSEISKIKNELNGLPDIIIEGTTSKEIPSTIVNCRWQNPIIERLGVVNENEIINILRNE
jgi:L-threonylcarbamoyladenylate synthase